MDPIEKPTAPSGWLDRFSKSWFPPAAVVGAFAAFTTASFRNRPATRATPVPKQPLQTPAPAAAQAVASQAATPVLEREYFQSALLGGSASPHAFHRYIAGVAVDTEDWIWTLGDDEVRAFGPELGFVRSWKIPQRAVCLAVGPDRRIYVGSRGRVDIYDQDGSSVGGFAAGDTAKPGYITAIKVYQGEILAGDAGARYIRRYNEAGRQLGLIGTQNKTGGFMLPNGFLDFAVDAGGVVRATDSGRHRVTAWSIDGTPRGQFGKFGQFDPACFTGCCNPVNLAVTPDGKVVTGEKAAARVKVYEPDGKLLAVIGPENFDAGCTRVHLAVDSKGRILAADPVQRVVKIFTRL